MEDFKKKYPAVLKARGIIPRLYIMHRFSTGIKYLLCLSEVKKLRPTLPNTFLRRKSNGAPLKKSLSSDFVSLVSASIHNLLLSVIVQLWSTRCDLLPHFSFDFEITALSAFQQVAPNIFEYSSGLLCSRNTMLWSCKSTYRGFWRRYILFYSIVCVCVCVCVCIYIYIYIYIFFFFFFFFFTFPAPPFWNVTCYGCSHSLQCLRTRGAWHCNYNTLHFKMPNPQRKPDRGLER